MRSLHAGNLAKWSSESPQNGVWKLQAVEFTAGSDQAEADVTTPPDRDLRSLRLGASSAGRRSKSTSTAVRATHHAGLASAFGFLVPEPRR